VGTGEVLVELPGTGLWKIFDGERFREIERRCVSCPPGSLLMCSGSGGSRFFRVESGGGLVRVSRRKATSMILGRVDLEELRYFRVVGFSGGRYIFCVFEWDDSEVFFFSLPGGALITRRLLRRRVRSLEGLRDVLAPGFCGSLWGVSSAEAEGRSLGLLREVISGDDRLRIVGGAVEVRSVNGRVYYVSLEDGGVRRDDGKRCCVKVRFGFGLPRYDRVLSKALTIAYEPHHIYTL